MKLNKAFTLVLFLLSASSCSPGFDSAVPKVANVFDPAQNSGQVRYEHVNERGEFVSNETVVDPLKTRYSDTIWTASQKSASQTIRSNTSLNRINLVFVGDGYARSELKTYAQDVETSTQKIFASEPFRTYQNYFAVHRVDVVSSESGVSEERIGVKKKTALEMTFNCSGIPRLLCANVNKVMAEAQNAPKADAVFSIANTATYGGAGYMSPRISTFAGRNPASLELALHEFAHSFAGLTDEYDANGVPANCNSFANVTQESESEMARRKSKWYRWLDLPHVGSFKGSCYSLQFYRPTENSKMRTLGQVFDVVNSEQFVLHFYKYVRPIEFATGPGSLGVTGEIEIVPMKPVGHAMKIEWSIDGKVNAALSGQQKIFPKTLGLKRGLRRISVAVTDPTTFVRDEEARKRDMTHTLSWDVKID